MNADKRGRFICYGHGPERKNYTAYSSTDVLPEHQVGVVLLDAARPLSCEHTLGPLSVEVYICGVGATGTFSQGHHWYDFHWEHYEKDFAEGGGET